MTAASNSTHGPFPSWKRSSVWHQVRAVRSISFSRLTCQPPQSHNRHDEACDTIFEAKLFFILPSSDTSACNDVLWAFVRVCKSDWERKIIMLSDEKAELQFPVDLQVTRVARQKHYSTEFSQRAVYLSLSVHQHSFNIGFVINYRKIDCNDGQSITRVRWWTLQGSVKRFYLFQNSDRYNE